MSREVNGRWAVSHVVALLADAMDENPDGYDIVDRDALDAAGQVVFRIEGDETYHVREVAK